MDDHIAIEKGIDKNTIARVYASVFRKSYEKPGFIVLSFGKNMTSRLLRRCMVELKRGLSEQCKKEFNQELDYCWLARFDQQKTTKYHRDNAPKDSYLMLGYEPTAIDSILLFADYHRFVTENNIPIDQYYELYNPIFQDGEKKLYPYVKEATGFAKDTYRIVVINNSDLHSSKTQGILHKAEINTADARQPRIVNSMMLYLQPLYAPRNKSQEEERAFIETDEISK